MQLAPKWALSAQAIDAAGNPYLAKGVHLRIVPSQEFGLPIAPFIVYRADLTQLLQRLTRTDILWIDQRGQVLLPPFTIPRGESVTGWLPPIDRGVCCWIQVQVEKVGQGGVQMDGLVHNARLPLKPSVIGTTTRIQPTLSASRIDRVVLSGEAQVFGARWIDARSLPDQIQPSFWKLLPLPVGSGPRYISVFSAQDQAKDRVERGAPLLMGRHEEQTRFFASTGGAVGPGDELNRVTLFQPDIDQWLSQLVYDLSLPLHDLTTPYRVQADGAQPMAQENLNVNTLGLLMQSSIDPGIARYLGFMESDQEVVGLPDGTLIAYLIRGLFRFDKKRHSQYLRALGKEQVISPEEGLKIFQEFDLKLSELKELDALTDFTTVAIATLGNPPDIPAPPLMRPADTSGPFLPDLPPSARREVVLRGDNLTPLVALNRLDSSGPVSLNRLTPDKNRALPLIPTVPNPGITSAQGEFADRTAPPDALRYQIAQADWFGRWSAWVELDAAAKPRPLPPVPAPTVTYTPLTVTTTTPLDTPLAGTLRVEIPVPPLENLPTGGFPLRQARIVVREGTTELLTFVQPGDPHALSDRKLVIRLTDHPALRLTRTATRRVSLTATWEDTAGQVSATSPPVEIMLTDPRPPAAVTIPDTLLYSARPDISGIARVRLRWTIVPTQRRFRVYSADEGGAITFLRGQAPTNPVASAALTAINAALTPVRDPVALAMAFKTHAATLPRSVFDQLTREPIAFTGSEASFTHDLSGSLQVLSLYRVVAVSEGNVEAPFETSALVPVAVPNTAPPAQPFLTLRAIATPEGRPRGDQLDLIVEAARRPTRPVEYRLRRSTVGGTDALSMPIVATGVLPAPDGETVRIEISQGIAAPNALRPWIAYFWRVEVRGAAEPGAVTMTGQWSSPSAPVTATLIPPTAPAPVENLTVTRTATADTLSWTHPDPRLNGGAMGTYQFEIFQQKPGDRPRSIGKLPATAPPSAGGRTTPTAPFTFAVPIDATAFPGTQYRVVLSDPLNRTSSPVIVTVSTP